MLDPAEYERAPAPDPDPVRGAEIDPDRGLAEYERDEDPAADGRLAPALLLNVFLGSIYCSKRPVFTGLYLFFGTPFPQNHFRQ